MPSIDGGVFGILERFNVVVFSYIFKFSMVFDFGMVGIGFKNVPFSFTELLFADKNSDALLLKF